MDVRDRLFGVVIMLVFGFAWVGNLRAVVLCSPDDPMLTVYVVGVFMSGVCAFVGVLMAVDWNNWHPGRR